MPKAFHKVGDANADAVYILQSAAKPGCYALCEPFVYQEPKGKERSFTVPKRIDLDPDTKDRFETDLATIPFFATWLVPRDGRHTPAALLHDALLLRRFEMPDGTSTIDHHDADRVFRVAMQFLKVTPLRRWLMWAGVSIGTLTRNLGRPWKRLYWGLVVGLTILIALSLNLRAVAALTGLDLADSGREIGEWITRLEPVPVIGLIVNLLSAIFSFLRRLYQSAWEPLETYPFWATLVWLALWNKRLSTGVWAAGTILVLGFPMLVAIIGFVVYYVPALLVALATRAIKWVAKKSGMGSGGTSWPNIPTPLPVVKRLEPQYFEPTYRAKKK